MNKIIEFVKKHTQDEKVTFKDFCKYNNIIISCKKY